jgi:hypothetical protein
LAPPTGRGPDRAAEFLRACEGQVSGALGGGALGRGPAAHAAGAPAGGACHLALGVPALPAHYRDPRYVLRLALSWGGSRLRRGCLVHAVLTTWMWHPHRMSWYERCRSDWCTFSRQVCSARSVVVTCTALNTWPGTNWTAGAALARSMNSRSLDSRPWYGPQVERRVSWGDWGSWEERAVYSSQVIRQARIFLISSGARA